MGPWGKIQSFSMGVNGEGFCAAYNHQNLCFKLLLPFYFWGEAQNFLVHL
jgi:hypothetical protein